MRSRRMLSGMLHSALALTGLVCLTQMAVAQATSTQTPSFADNVKAVHFPFDVYKRIIDSPVLEANSESLKQNSNKMWIQGYADPRGDIVYNLVLSYRRAQWVKAQLEKRGVDGSRIEYATGWGKLYQTCESKDEQCFQENRRVDIVSPETMMFHFAGQ